MRALSSNAFSVDDQIADVISYLSLSDNYDDLMRRKFTVVFPEYNSLEWSGSWVDWEASNVDPDYMSWITEWIEANTFVFWYEGEPFLADPDDAYPDEED